MSSPYSTKIMGGPWAGRVVPLECAVHKEVKIASRSWSLWTPSRLPLSTEHGELRAPLRSILLWTLGRAGPAAACHPLQNGSTLLAALNCGAEASRGQSAGHVPTPSSKRGWKGTHLAFSASVTGDVGGDLCLMVEVFPNIEAE